MTTRFRSADVPEPPIAILAQRKMARSGKKPAKRLSLYGMTPEDAVRKALNTPPRKKTKAAKKPNKG